MAVTTKAQLLSLALQRMADWGYKLLVNEREGDSYSEDMYKAYKLLQVVEQINDSDTLTGQQITAYVDAIYQIGGTGGEDVTTAMSALADGNVIASLIIPDGLSVPTSSLATGDIIYYNGTNWSRLPIGSASQVLTVSSSLPSWQAAAGGGGGWPLTGSESLTGNTTIDTNNFDITFDGDGHSGSQFNIYMGDASSTASTSTFTPTELALSMSNISGQAASITINSGGVLLQHDNVSGGDEINFEIDATNGVLMNTVESSGSDKRVLTIEPDGDIELGGSDNPRTTYIIKTNSNTTASNLAINPEGTGNLGLFGDSIPAPATTAPQSALWLGDSSQAPVGSFSSGGFVYVTGTSLRFLADDGVNTILNPAVPIIIVASAVGVDITTGTNKANIKLPFAGTITDIKATVSDGNAPTGSSIIADVNLDGSTIMTTNKLEIEVNEFSTRDAATAPTLTTTAFTEDQEITVDIDQIGSTIAGQDLIVTLYVTQS